MHDSVRTECVPSSVYPGLQPMFERFTESARRALFFARYEASLLGGISIETEHLLLGVARHPKGIVARLLTSPQASYEALRKEVEDRISVRAEVPTSVEIPFSAETQRALRHAAEEANRLGHSYIGTEHLLLGLLREEQSVAGTILTRHGYRADDVREAILTVLAEPASPATAPAPASSDAGVSTRINEISRSVERLIDMLPDGSDARTLGESIRESLKMLKPHVRD